MLGRLRNTFAEVDLSRLEQNYLRLKGALGKKCFMAPMIKANAYGHGDIQVARVCEKLGARYLGVALVEEGVRLRLAGIQAPILVFSHFDTMGAEAMIKYRLTPVISQHEQIKKLKTALHETANYPVHIKFNTGMQRLGFEPEEAKQLATLFANENHLRLEGACTHFASSEDFGITDGATAEQVKIFQKIISDMKPQAQGPVLYHYLNSSAILSALEPQMDMARPGIALYGAVPSLHVTPRTDVLPVMSVKSFVGFLHNVKKGTKVSYGGTWEAKRDSVIAVIPMGYADGLPRALSNKGQVLIRGERCNITGIICMDYFMADVTDLVALNKAPVIGDEVVIFGEQNKKQIRVEEVAKLAQTISYEILTGIQARVPRIYIH